MADEQPTAATNGPPELLQAARAALHRADRDCALLRDAGVNDQELGDAVARIQEAHGLLWRLSRRVAGDEARTEAAPLTMSIDYVAWVLADRHVDHWTAQLLRLMVKADPVHRAQLATLFPREYAAVEEWYDAPFGQPAGWPVPHDPEGTRHA